jgi:hypothetical protein
MNPRILTRLGWLLFALGWIPFAGIFIGMIGLPDGSYAWSELPRLMRYSIIATFVTFGFAMVVLFGSPLLSWWTNRRVRREGQRASAKILEVWDTGTTINENPVVGIRLEVHPIAGAPFIAKTQQLVSRLRIQDYKTGKTVNVRYDPESKDVALLED